MIMIAVHVLTFLLLGYFHCGAARAGNTGNYNSIEDIAFIIDESKSVGKENFIAAKTFVKNVIKLFPLAPTLTRFAVMTYDETPSIPIYFHYRMGQEVSLLLEDIDQIPYRGQERRMTGAALARLTSRVFKSRNGARGGNVPKVAVLITNGYSHDGVQAQAQLAKWSGIEIFALGIGIGVDELHQIASPPVTDHVFIYYDKSYDALPSFAQQVAKKISRRGLPLTTTTTSATTTTTTTTTTATTTAEPTTTASQPNTTTATPSATATIIATAPETTARVDNCVDKFVTCAALGPRVCTSLVVWSRAYCSKFCDLCPDTTQLCSDKVPNCQSFGDTICSAHLLSGWVDQNCRKYCNRC